MDIVTLVAALNGSKKYTDTVAQSLRGGVRYKGEVDYYSDLPNNAEVGDSYTVKYSGTSGTDPDGTEYTWGLNHQTQQYTWIDFSKDSYTKTETNNLLNGKQNIIDSSNKLSADVVDDTNATNKFATAAQLEQIATNTGDINTINGFLENTKIESWNIADTGRLCENTYVTTEGVGTTHYYEPYFTLIDIEIPAGATTLYFDCTALENQDAGAYSMFFLGSLEGFIPTGKSIAIPNRSTKLEITFPYVGGDYTNKTKGKYYISFETPTGRYDTITIDGVSTNVVPKEVLDDDLAGKQDALTFDSAPTSESTNPVTSDGVYTALATKQDTISDLSTIRSNATAGAEAATVVQGIDETGNNYIELKSGRREYLSTTVPTGNIPTGSVGMGFDEGVFTYKSGTKVSDGIEITDSSDPHYQQKKFSFYANGQSLADYTIYGATGGVGDKTANIITGRIENVNIDANGQLVANTGFDAVYAPIAQGEKYYIQSIDVIYAFYSSLPAAGSTSYDGARYSNPTVITAPIDGYIVCRVQKTLSNAMINEGETAIPYEPYDKFKIPVICGGQTTNVYLDSPLGANDSIDYTTSQTAIPTVDGANNLICDTTVQPSKLSLTYTGWHSDLETIEIPEGGTICETLYSGTQSSSSGYDLTKSILDYKLINIMLGTYDSSNHNYRINQATIPVDLWRAFTMTSNNYVVLLGGGQFQVNEQKILPLSSNSNIVYMVQGIK